MSSLLQPSKEDIVLFLHRNPPKSTVSSIAMDREDRHIGKTVYFGWSLRHAADNKKWLKNFGIWIKISNFALSI